MKIQIVSDLHADGRWPQSLAIGADVEVVIAAGDICEGAVQAFAVLRKIVPDSRAARSAARQVRAASVVRRRRGATSSPGTLG
jgi:hypothetical protein